MEKRVKRRQIKDQIGQVAQVRGRSLRANLGYISQPIRPRILQRFSIPHGLKRFHNSRQSHFVAFTCYHRQRGFDSPNACDLLINVLENMRHRFAVCIYGYVVMPGISIC